MASKSLLVLGLAFAIVLLIASEAAAAKDQQASNKETQSVETNGVEDAKIGGLVGGGSGGRGRYNGRGGRYNNGGGGRYNLPKIGCKIGCCALGYYYNGPGCSRCCSSLQEATAFKQTQAQTHN